MQDVCAGLALDIDKVLVVGNSETKFITTAWLTSLFSIVVELVLDLSAEPCCILLAGSCAY